MKKLTICMPVYNGEKYLDESIGSVLGQSYGDFKFFILDDCSTDGSVEKIKSFKDKRIKLFAQKSNIGTFSLVPLMEALDTEYVMFIDQDDRFCRNDAFAYSLKSIKSNNYDFVNFTSELEVDENGNKTRKKPLIYGDFSYCGDNLFEKFFPCDNHFIFHSKIFRSEIIKKSIPYDMIGKRFSSGDMFFSAMWWFNARRYLNIASEDPIYEYKNFTGVWGSKKSDLSPQRIGELCVCSYNVLISLYNRMVEIRPLTSRDVSALVMGVNIPMICRIIMAAKRKHGDEYCENLKKIFYCAFCEDGRYLLKGVKQFDMPLYVKKLEDMMK